MTSIFSAISGQFSKSLVLGFFMPVALFTVLTILFLSPLLPANHSFLQPLHALDKEWQVAAIFFVVVLLTGLLYNLNIPIIRLYEGYPWKESWIGTWMVSHNCTIYNEAKKLRAQLRFIRDCLSKISGTAARLARLQHEQTQLALLLNDGFPDAESLILPTRLGNVIRAFEFYPQKQYGIGAINLWPRLVAKVDKDYAAIIDEAKASFDFMINCSILSAAAGFLVLVAGLWLAAPFDSRRHLAVWTVKWAACFLLSILSYYSSIGRADAWGKQVKGAFDLYRLDLLKQLGYKQSPGTRDEERKLWQSISKQIVYGDPILTAPLPYCTIGPEVSADPPTVRIDVVKGITWATSSGPITVSFRIRNVDPQNVVAKVIKVTDVIPDGFCYIWKSESVDVGTVAVVGTNPLALELGDVPPDRDIILSYSAALLAPPKPSEQKPDQPVK